MLTHCASCGKQSTAVEAAFSNSCNHQLPQLYNFISATVTLDAVIQINLQSLFRYTTLGNAKFHKPFRHQ
jgi:hypothetical protein